MRFNKHKIVILISKIELRIRSPILGVFIEINDELLAIMDKIK